jgi:diguanylate cyclase (GGDEF)-like protein
MARVDGMLRIKHRHDEVQQARANLEQLAIEDELTGLYNYRYLHTRLAEEFKRSERYRDPLACAMVDIDHFKKVNDTYGHQAGDEVIRITSALLQETKREIDIAGRYGGEEFCVILLDTDCQGGRIFAERLRKAVEATRVNYDGQEIRFRISLGVAEIREELANHSVWLEQADKALYQSKEGGRNRTTLYTAE